ncbi:MAG: MFS transporter [Alphaproteobacteria bacterium]|nr:MFS transporter [Alphaproteobacteria bacterium]MDA7984885.1 MFS transporter [Alphaproteobacteria bacterium]MDA7987686.1 MFS transporter [Alphaproteobacteria bacterium]MDA7989155.1 MFS transporter [Alphaproteobacteria bacterium]MDA7999720.1 MFS transporter [Alphaproteobacteria bacterium]
MLAQVKEKINPMNPAAGRVIFGAPQALWVAVVVAYPVGIIISFITLLSSLVFERNGYSATLNGICTSAGFFGALVGMLFLPFLSSRVATARTVYTGIAISCVCCVLSAAYFGAWTWIILRVILGVSFAAQWVYSEAWIMSLAPPKKRTFFLGVYGAVVAFGYFSGPLLIGLLGSDHRLMLLPAGLFFVVFLIVRGNRAILPDLPMREAIFSRRLLKSMPMLAGLAFLAGAAEETPLALGAVWGLRNGWSETLTVSALFAFALGCALWQLPVGWVGDKLRPARVLVFVLLSACVLPLSLALTDFEGAALFLVFLLWGGAVFSIYTLALAVLAERTRAQDIARANGLYIVMFSAGVVAGPPVIGAAMEAGGPDWMLYCLSAMPLVFLAFWTAFRRRE